MAKKNFIKIFICINIILIAISIIVYANTTSIFHNTKYLQENYLSHKIDG